MKCNSALHWYVEGAHTRTHTRAEAHTAQFLNDNVCVCVGGRGLSW